MVVKTMRGAGNVPKNENGDYVEMKDALDAWEPFAIALLLDTARTYSATTTYGRLATRIQDDAGIEHSPVISNWIGEVLNRVIKYCGAHGTPQLSSLVVREDGLVGDGYLAALKACNANLGEPTHDDLDDHAAKERLECYRYFGAAMPADGGKPSLTPKARAKREYKRAEAKRDVQAVQCDGCHETLPMTGKCDNCD